MDPTAKPIGRHELIKAAATTNMAILGLTFDDDDPATTAHGESTSPAIKIERSKHGEHTTPADETAPSSLQFLCPRPHLQVSDPCPNVCHLVLTTMGSIPPDTNPDPAYSLTTTTDTFEVGWFLRKFKAYIAFSCGTMGSDKLLLLLEYMVPPLGLAFRVRVLVRPYVLRSVRLSYGSNGRKRRENGPTTATTALIAAATATATSQDQTDN